MRNRHGDEYTFVRLNENEYAIKGELKYWRFGGREGQQRVDFTNLGYVDPSGGPFISIGMKIEDREIINISADGNLDYDPNIVFKVQ